MGLRPWGIVTIAQLLLLHSTSHTTIKIIKGQIIVRSWWIFMMSIMNIESHPRRDPYQYLHQQKNQYFKFLVQNSKQPEKKALLGNISHYNRNTKAINNKRPLKSNSKTNIKWNQIKLSQLAVMDTIQKLTSLLILIIEISIYRHINSPC